METGQFRRITDPISMNTRSPLLDNGSKVLCLRNAQGGTMLTGVLSDSDIEIIERVLEKRCVLLAIKPDTQEGQKVARQLVDLFQHGVTKENELMRHPIAFYGVQI